MTGDGEHSIHKMVMTWGWFLWHWVYRIISIPLVYHSISCYVSSLYGDFLPKSALYIHLPF